MKIYRFDDSVGVPLTAYGSHHVLLTRIARSKGNWQMGCMHLQADGVIKNHPAAVPQLFLVIQGEGWVRGGSGEEVKVEAGQAAFWEQGEEHESGTHAAEGMVALVIEADNLDPSQFMVEVEK